MRYFTLKYLIYEFESMIIQNSNLRRFLTSGTFIRTINMGSVSSDRVRLIIPLGFSDLVEFCYIGGVGVFVVFGVLWRMS